MIESKSIIFMACSKQRPYLAPKSMVAQNKTAKIESHPESMPRQHKIRNMDRFSALPDEVAHLIMELVSPEDISRLSVVSKRCLHLCLSTPFIDINDSRIRGRDDAAKRAQLINFVDRLLLSRRCFSPDIPFFRFNLIELCGDQQVHSCLSWLHQAVLSNVVELRLSVAILRDGSDFTFPSSLVSCPSLEFLTLIFMTPGATFEILPPHLASFSSLKSLVLISVRIDQPFFEWISRCCKCLDNLVLNSTQGTNDITITSSSLTTLSLWYTYTSIRLQVYAENLDTLTLVLLTPSDNSSKAPKLVTPKLRVFHQILVKPFGHGCFDLKEQRKLGPALLHIPRMSSDLRQLSSHIAVLSLFGDTIEYMYEKQLLPIDMPHLLKINMDLRSASNVDLVLLMASFLPGTPNLKHLFLAFSTAATVTSTQEGDMKSAQIEAPAPELKSFPVIPKLTLLQFGFPYGVQKNKLELIKFLISAETINLLCPTPLPCDVSSLIEAYGKTVNVIHWALARRPT